MQQSLLSASLATIALVLCSPAMANTGDAASTLSGQPQGDADTAAQQGDSSLAIVVTARRKAETVLDVPMTLNVMGGEALARQGITNSSELQSHVPALAIAPADREANVAIRGISNNVRSVAADPSNAISINGVYLPQSKEVLTELYDLSRVEVLKGPQNLYGRNATGGAINLVTPDPVAGFEAQGFVGAGSRGLMRGQGVVSGGSDKLSARVALNYARDDGYTYNKANGQKLDAIDYLGGRATVKWAPTDTFSATAFWQYSRDDGSLGYGISINPALGGYFATAVPASYLRSSPRVINSNTPMYSHSIGNVGGLTLSQKIGDVTVKSISAYTSYHNNDSYDVDGGLYNFYDQITRTRVHSYSEELQAFNNHGTAIDWILGAFIYHDNGYQFIDNKYLNSSVALSNSKSNTTSESVYGQLTYHVAEGLSVAVGGRFTHDYKRGQRYNSTGTVATPIDAVAESSKFTPSFVLQYKPRENLNLYASVAQGYKSGGINLVGSAFNPVFKPETIWAYEAGVKGEFLDHRLTANISGFYNDYSKIQLKTVQVINQVNISSVTNAASAKIYGVEFSGTAKLVAGFSLDANAAWLHTSIKGFISPYSGTDETGLALPLSPRWSGDVGANFDTRVGTAGSIRARVDYSFRSSMLFPITYSAPYASADALGLLNATLRWTGANDHYYVEIIGKNLTDKLYLTQSSNFLPYDVMETYGAPRTIEGRIGFKF